MEKFDATFNCNGKVNINDWQLNNSSFFMKKDINTVLDDSKPCSNIIIKIFNFDTTGISVLLKLQHFIRSLESKLKQFERHEKLKSFNEKVDQDKSTNFYLLRKLICEFVYHMRNYLKCLKAENFALKDVTDEAESDFDDLLSTILKFLSRLKNIPASTFLYISSPTGNTSNAPEYHLYHIHLDLRWLLTTLIYVKNDGWECSNENCEELDNCIYNVTADLIYISSKIFANIPSTDLRTKTPYSCTCLRELWLMLQILTDKLNKQNKSKVFWVYVNSVLNLLFSNESVKDVPTLEVHKNLSDCKNPELFCIWLIYHLTLLYGYDTNGIYSNSSSNRYQEIQMKSCINQVEKILKVYVNKGGKDGARDEIDEELCVMIPLLQILCFEWWQSNLQIIALLWDCFHKRLEKPFLMQFRGPWSTSSEKKTPMDILNNIKDRLKNNNEISQESSFGLFLRLLGIFLKKNYSRTELKAWNQIKGRIYSKFTQNKLREFSEWGLYNFISLFLTLAITADIINVTTTMMNFLPPVLEWSDVDGGKKCSLIWKSKLIVLLLYNEQKLSFKDVAKDFTETANAISCRQDECSRSMMTWFIDILKIILTQNDDFERDEHAFLGGWIDRYLHESAPNRVVVLTSTLLKVFQKCISIENRHSSGSNLMINALWNHAASRVRLMATTCDLSTNFYENPTKLAAAFTLEACRDPNTSKKFGHSAAKLFQHFTTSPILKDMRIIKLYSTLILQNESAVEYLRKEKEIKDFDLLCVQVWIKCNILNKEINEQHHFLKNYIANISVVKEMINSDRDYNEFLQSSEPFLSFLTIVSRKRNTFKLEQEQMTFDIKCRSFIFNIEKWVLQLINDENKDSKISIWTYQCIGSIIKYWAPILYSKSSTNMLKTLVNKIALPLDQQSPSYCTYLSQKIFSMIILGFENLNISSDVSLQNLIRELFERYLPLLITQVDGNEHSFKVADTLSKCFFAKSDFTKSIFFILASNLITIPHGQATHKVCYLVMLLLINLIKAGRMYTVEILESIISECTAHIINCYIRVHDSHPHKKHTMDFLREITSNIYYKEILSIREKLNDVTWNVLKKSIVPYSKASFDILKFIFKINKELFKYLYSHSEIYVSECEKNQISNAGALRFLLNNIKKT